MIGKIRRNSWYSAAVLQGSTASNVQVADKVASALAAKGNGATEPSWDPYDVWLNRVRQPRLKRDADERRPRDR